MKALATLLVVWISSSFAVMLLMAWRAAAPRKGHFQRVPRRRGFTGGRIHSSRTGDAMEHAHPNCTGLWSMVVDVGQGPKWIVCHRCRQYYVVTESRLTEARRQNDFALDLITETNKGAATLADERAGGAA